MIAIIVHWERAAWAYKYKDAMRKIQKWHAFAMKPFGVKRLLIVDIDSNDLLLWSDAELIVSNHATIDDALADLAGYIPVFVEGGVEGSKLKTFVHPVGDTVYIFGSDYSPTKMDIAGRKVIEIEQSSEYYMMWVPIPIGIVLHDRYVKEL